MGNKTTTHSSLAEQQCTTPPSPPPPPCSSSLSLSAASAEVLHSELRSNNCESLHLKSGHRTVAVFGSWEVNQEIDARGGRGRERM